MGNIVGREKPQKRNEKHKVTTQQATYRSLLEISVEKERPVKTDANSVNGVINMAHDANSVNSLINMVHDNVISRKLIFKGPFGQRRCKGEIENILITP